MNWAGAVTGEVDSATRQSVHHLMNVALGEQGTERSFGAVSS